MSGLGKSEDELEAAFEAHPLPILRTHAGWIVSTDMPQETLNALPDKHKALLGQSTQRQPAVSFLTRTSDGDEIEQTFTLDRAPLAELILELVGTFLDRDMFKQLVSALPEEWSR